MTLHYQAPRGGGASPLINRTLAATVAGLPILTAAYSHVGTSIAQAWTGRRFLFSAAAGTDAYETALVLAPFCIVTGVLGGLMVLSITLAAMRRWPDTWAWVCPASAIAWLLFMAAVVPRWGVVSP